MLGFHFKLAIKSIKKTPWISTVSILAISIGIAVATASTVLHHVLSRDPLPHKSENIYSVRIDTWEIGSEFFGIDPGDPPKTVTYMDMNALLNKRQGKMETGVGNAAAYAFPEDKDIKPFQATVRLAHADFFPMFELPFRYGSGWTREDDVKRSPVVVLSEECNDKIFGGADSVGRTVKLGALNLRVIGVLDTYNPTPMIYDPINSGTGPAMQFIVPFDHIRNPDSGLNIMGNTDSWGDNATFQGDSLFTAAEYHWPQFWVELEPGGEAAYKQFVDDYAAQLKTMGRHPRPINNRVMPAMDWYHQWRSSTIGITRGVAIISYLFLAVCAINLMGLLLGKFLARASLIGVHRALGASRRSVFFQHILECEMVGLLGGVVGLGFSFLALIGLRSLLPSMPGFSSDIFRLDLFAVGVGVSLSLIAGLLAGLYPAWRACRVSPAIQLKV